MICLAFVAQLGDKNYHIRQSAHLVIQKNIDLFYPTLKLIKVKNPEISRRLSSLCFVKDLAMAEAIEGLTDSVMNNPFNMCPIPKEFIKP